MPLEVQTFPWLAEHPLTPVYSITMQISVHDSLGRQISKKFPNILAKRIQKYPHNNKG